MTKPRNLTPDHLRCAIGTCPSVHDIEGDRLLIVGKKGWPVICNEKLEIPVSDDEQAIIIDKALLGKVLAEAIADEREACAKIVDAAAWSANHEGIAARIRSRSQSDILPLGKGGQQDLVQTDVQQVETPSGHLGSEKADAKYLQSAIRDGEAHVIMGMVREMDAVVHLLGIEDSFETPSEMILKLLALSVSQGDGAALTAPKSQEGFETKNLPHPATPETGH
jgi:hypothetical protein